MNLVLSYLLNGSLITAIVLFILYLLKDYLSSFIVKNIEFKYQTDLEKFKTILRKEEAQDKFIHDAVLSTVRSENNILISRQISAIDTLWNSILFYKKYFWVISFLSATNMEEFKKRANETKIQEFLKIFPDQTQLLAEIKSEVHVNPETARPWISLETWALYSCYNLIIYYGIFQITALKIGGNEKTIDDLYQVFDKSKFIDMLQILKPEIDVASAENQLLPKYLETIESKLISELKKNLYGKDASQANKERAINTINIATDIFSEAKNKINIKENNLNL